MFRRIDHIELVPADVDKTLSFYTEVFGFSVRSRQEVNAAPIQEVIYLELGDTVIELLSVEAPPPTPHGPFHVGYRAIALEVDDMDEAISYLQAKGIAPTWGPTDLGTSTRAEVLDPNGLIVELREWKT